MPCVPKTFLLLTLTAVLVGSAVLAHPVAHLNAAAQLADGVKQSSRSGSPKNALQDGLSAHDALMSTVIRRRRRRTTAFGRLRGGSRAGAIAGLVMLALFVLVVLLLLRCLWRRRVALRERAEEAKDSAMRSTSPRAASNY